MMLMQANRLVLGRSIGRSKGAQGLTSTLRSNFFFLFHAVSETFAKIIAGTSSPLGLVPPPLNNPGSATASHCNRTPCKRDPVYSSPSAAKASYFKLTTDRVCYHEASLYYYCAVLKIFCSNFILIFGHKFVQQREGQRKTVADPGFPRRGAPIPMGALPYYLEHIFQKLQKNKEFWSTRARNPTLLK